MSDSNAHRNLLFGILGMQMDFISREDLIAATSVWVTDKTRPLDHILLERRVLDEEEHQLLKALVKKHLEKHDGDHEKSLASVSSVDRSVRSKLVELGDSDVKATLGHVRVQAPSASWEATVSYAGGDSAAPMGQRFRVLRPHAKGGLGQVSVAMDEELNREVALKEIQPQHAEHADSRNRFLQEAEITGGLEHPGIVPVYGLGQYGDGRPFYAMRFIRGNNLKEAIDRFHCGTEKRDPGETDLQLRQLLGRIIDVCDAIEYAHSRGVLHRDLKPGNVMLGKYGETLVVDWGLAKAAGKQDLESQEVSLRPSSGSGMAPTQMGQAVGTPAYMSPEQAAGRLDQLGPASDVYSLGATLYCLLAGQPPFDEEDMGTLLRKVEDGEFPKPRAHNRNLSPALEAICLKAMALRPDDRYASVAALADDLEHWLADETVSVHSDSITVRFGRWARRHKTLVAGATTLLVASLISLTAGLVLLERERRRTDDARASAVENERNATAQRELADANAEEARHNLYVAHMQQVQLEWEKNHIRRARELLKRYAEPAGKEDLRGLEWYYWQRECNASLRTLPQDHLSVRAVAINSGGILATAEGFGGGESSPSQPCDISLWDVGSGRRLRTITGHEAWITGVTFNSDGNLLASVSPGRRRRDGQKLMWDDSCIIVWDVDTGEQLHKLESSGATFWCLAFSPDGRELFGGGRVQESAEGIVTVWDVANGMKLKSFSVANGAYVSDIAMNPDGRSFGVAGSRLGGVRVLDSNDGTPIQRLDIRMDPDFNSGESIRVSAGNVADQVPPDCQLLAFSSDGKTMATDGHSGGTILLWDVATGNLRRSLRGHDKSINRLVASPAGKWLLTCGDDNTVRVWSFATGRELRVYRGHEDSVFDIAFSPDGLRFASASSDQTVKLWDWTGTQSLPMYGVAATIVDAAFDPMATKFAVIQSMYGAEASVWDMTTGRRLLSLPGATSCVSFNFDGSLLATSNPEHEVVIWDIENANIVRRSKGHRHNVWDIVFSANGEWLASADADYIAAQRKHDPGEVKVWNAASGEELFSFEGYVNRNFGITRTYKNLAFCPNSRLLAASVRTKGHIGQPNSEAEFAVQVWDVATQRVVRSFDMGSSDVKGISFRPGGDELAVATFLPAEIRVWRVSTGEEVFSVEEPEGYFSGVSFTSDGRRLISYGPETKIWHAESGELVTVIPRRVDPPFSPDGWHAFGGNLIKRGVFLWDFHPLTEERRTASEARRLVDYLARKPLLKADVLTQIQELSTISEPVRHQAQALAGHLLDQPYLFHSMSWSVVQNSTRTAGDYREALRLARVAEQLVPNDGEYLKVLGVAEYRAGEFEAALETLQRSFAINEQKHQGKTDLAFLAMAYFQLGQKEDAASTLQKARDSSGSAIASRFLREASSLIETGAQSESK